MRSVSPHRPGLYSVKALLGLCALGALLSSHPARAGSYVGTYTVPVPDSDPVTYEQIPYSGGTHYSVTGQTSPGHYTFGDLPDYPEGAGYGGASSGNGVPGEGTHSDCSGPISTSWTWTPAAGKTLTTDPPPTQVIIMQTCTATASVGLPGGTGTYSTGLGSSGSVAFTPPNNPPGTATDTVYSAHAGGATCALDPISPSASVSNAPSSASVSYSATVTPVFVKLTGPIQDSNGNWDILIGQGCKAELTGIPTGGGWSTPTYQWSVTGTTFQKWSPTTPALPPAAANPNASYYDDGPGPLDQPTAHWYWNEAAATETVKCIVTLTPPAGEGSTFTVTASKKVNVKVPDWTATGTGGTMLVDTSKPPSNGTDYWLHAGPIAGSGETGGMDWRATVTSPDSALFGAGTLAIAQLITPDLNYTSGTYTGYWSLNGQNGLDTAFPYPWTTQAPNYFGGDLPGIDVSTTGLTSAHVGNVFDDYLMYQPPGTDVQWVPLGTFHWSTNGNATIPNPGGWPTFSGSAGTITPSGTSVPFSAIHTFPSWGQNSGNNPPSSGHF